MDRNRDARRSAIAAPNGLSRRRHRSSSLRDSPEDDGPVETSRLRDRKKDRDRDRDREKDRDRDRDRLSRSKRRRGERLMHGSNREDSRDDSSEESVNDEDEDEDEDGGGSGVGGGGSSIRMLPPNHPSSTASLSSSMINHRKSFSPVHNLNSNKHFRPLTALKVTDEMIGVSVPRKARSASTKRSNEWPSSCGVVGDQIHRQASTSPVRPSVSSSTPAPTSPSSSHASAVRKRLKPNGPKLRPPKSLSTKTASSNQDEIEKEVAEVLYGMKRQPQGPTKQEITATDSIKFESRETNNKFTSDAKSRVSSPISNSPCVVPQLTSPFPQNSCSSVTSMSAAAPKRKRPRPVKYEDENPAIFAVQNSPISSTAKMVADQPSKVETSSPKLEKNPGSAAENGGFAYDLPNSQAVQAAPASMEAQPEAIKPESNVVSNSRPASDESESRNVRTNKVELQSPKKESTGLRLDDKREEITLTKPSSTIPEVENHREEKFQIDLMAPPERDGEVDFISVDPKPAVVDAETDLRAVSREDNSKALKIGNKEEVQPLNLETEKSKAALEEAEAGDLKKQTSSFVGGKERNFDLQLDLEKTESFSGNKLPHNVAKQNTEKTVQSGSVPLPMSVAGWPSGLPPMGYMAPLPGVVSMDGSTVSSAPIQPPHLLFSQPRPKRCTTHCYIARNIYCHQQISRMNPFWPVAAGSGSLYGGAKHSNPNVLPPELLGNVPGRGVNPAQDKGQGIAMFPAQSAKEKTSQAANLVDAQRKQIVLQQALPPGPPTNILHGPAFIFPLSQQQAAPAPSVRPGSVKSSNAGGAASSSASNSASLSASAATAAAAPALSFNYPNMAGNEPQYLAILQNNAYPFPMPPHVGAQPAYRGPHAQAMPYFNGSFYPSQMLHPSQLQQQQQQPPPPSQSQQSQQGHPNTTISSGSSSSQKHLQNQQQRPHQSVVNGGSGSLQGFPASKNHPSQAIQLQQQQNLHVSRQLEPEMGGEDSPSTADSRVSRANMSIYGQNFAMPMHPPNFALMTPPSVGSASGATGASGSEKKQQQQQQGSKAGVEASQAFAMSFASLNGATVSPGIDITSMNHTILQNFPDVTRHSYHQYMAVAAAAQAAQQKKNYRGPEEGKTGGGDSSNVEEERKAMAGKASSNVGHSIAFSRADLTDTSGSTIPGNNVIDSSARAVNLSSTPVRSSSSSMPAPVSPANAPIPQQQMQQQMRNHQQQQPQQMYQLQKQQFSSVAPARNKTPTSNGSVYSDHLPSTSSMAAKFPNALSSFPQNLVQSSTSPAQSPQWKNSARITTSQVPSSSLASSTSSSLKNLPQKHGRTQQSHTQISFAANTKASTQSQGLQPASSNQSPSPPVMVGSPTTTTSSMSRSAGGSPRTTTSTSTGNKAGQISSFSSQQAKNSPSVPNQKSSPVGGRNVPSILGNTHITSSSAGTKPQLQQQHQQHQQQQLYKQSIQQVQFFSNAYMQPQASHSNSNTSTQSPSSGYYHASKRRPEQQQQSQGSSGTSSSGMLSLCPPVTHSNTSTNDPAKAAATAVANNMRGGNLSSQTLMHAQFTAAPASGPHQLVPAVVPAGFSYVQHAAVPTVAQVKPAEQKKQPAGE
ncbi:protein TIME FOR COFFEE-like isoform X2 [Pyrus communis]|uniref:protein TIME FOR COFFEE-like isoform X2 n=1 Tax=Pyrus communis TaxID=23211 RepID=UPI0035C1F3E0